MTSQPNILYVHSHDTGRYVQPYGHQVPTPNIQRLADQGLLFRQAFSAAAVCSGSRAALLTGQASHSTGMLGLAHRGYRLADTSRHLAHTLRDSGYFTALLGEQHLAADPEDIGYEHVVAIESFHADLVAPAAVELIEDVPKDKPFFLSVGFFETHRAYFEPTSVRDALYSAPPPNLPDTPEIRRDVAAFKASARSLDHGVGAVMNALDEADLADNTLVILTTDHGIPFPGAKATLTDRGIGVMLIVRGPGGFHGGRVSDALVSQIDLFPTICELAGIERPAWLQGQSLMPLLRKETDQVNDEIYAGITFHAAYEPQRAVRTARYKYIKRFDPENDHVVLPNVDESPSKDLLLEHDWTSRVVPQETLHDLIFDPNEATNLAGDPAFEEIRAGLAAKLHDWMVETEDPLLGGQVKPAPGTVFNLPTQRSADDPLQEAGPLDRPARSATAKWSTS
ncbi:MAG: sulfatase [Solirubrobacteraceae bacterium]|nr:sulfatase [Solirubrobacteraceae bacterium]